MSTEPVTKFEILLNETQLEPRLKHLWLEIYRNATYDRDQAGIFITAMTQELNDNAQSHVAYGPQATKYMELVRKSNDQLLKLAEQIRLYREDQGDLDTDDLLDEINNATGKS